MKDFATKYLEKYNGFSKLVKVLLCLLWDIPSTLYRVSKSALKDNMLGVILAVVLGIFGGWILFVIDIVTLLVKDSLLWLDDLGVDENKMATALKEEEPKEEAKSAEEHKEEAAPAAEPEESKAGSEATEETKPEE